MSIRSGNLERDDYVLSVVGTTNSLNVHEKFSRRGPLANQRGLLGKGYVLPQEGSRRRRV